LAHRMPDLKRFVVVTGHYGCGKTNLSLNLALDWARQGEAVTVVDLDIVNPYFRSSDYTALLAEKNVQVIAPRFAGTTLDTPSLSSGIYAAFESTGRVVFDVGGDDAGATALGRFSAEVRAVEHDLLYVINRHRNLTATPAEAAALLGEIEAASHLSATGVVNNSHLQRDTTVATVLDSREFAQETAALLGLPLVFSAVPKALAEQFSEDPSAANYIENAYPVSTYVRAPWEEAAKADEEVG